MIIDKLKNKEQITQYISHLLDAEREILLKTGYFDTQLQNYPAQIIHRNKKTYNQEQKNVINYLFKDNKKYKKMPIKQKCILECIVNEINNINTIKNDDADEKIFAISDIEGDVYSLLRFLKHIGALQRIDIEYDENSNPQLVPIWNDNFNSKIVFNGDHTSCRSFFNKECVDVLVSMQEKFGKKHIFLIKGNHEYNIYYDGADKGSILYNAKRKIYDKCIDKILLKSGNNYYHFMHAANFALACDKSALPKNFEHNVDDVYDFPRTSQMRDAKIISNISKFQYSLQKEFFPYQQNHHIVFGHDIDQNKTISRRLKKYGMLPIDNENKNYFRISDDNITEYDNNIGVKLDEYQIAKPMLSHYYQYYLQYYQAQNKQADNRLKRPYINKNLFQQQNNNRIQSQYNNNMANIFVRSVANDNNLLGYYLKNNKNYFNV